jgi:hypothetical protein
MSDFRIEENGITYKIISKSDGTSLAERSSGGVAGALVLRDFIEVNGKRIVLKEIGECAFRECPIKSIGIPSNVEVIRKDCFYHCESLCEVTFESSSKLKEIGEDVFCECAIKSIRIPSNVEVIGKKCFCYCRSLFGVTFEPCSTTL